MKINKSDWWYTTAPTIQYLSRQFPGLDSVGKSAIYKDYKTEKLLWIEKQIGRKLTNEEKQRHNFL